LCERIEKGFITKTKYLPLVTMETC